MFSVVAGVHTADNISNAAARDASFAFTFAVDCAAGDIIAAGDVITADGVL
jgi:hypothetical protein